MCSRLMRWSVEWYGACPAATYTSSEYLNAHTERDRKPRYRKQELAHHSADPVRALERTYAATEYDRELTKRARDRYRAQAILGAREAMKEIRESAAAREADESPASAYRARYSESGRIVRVKTALIVTH